MMCNSLKEGVHASLEELKTLSSEVKEKMFLMHYPDDWEKHNIDGFARVDQTRISLHFFVNLIIDLLRFLKKRVLRWPLFCFLIILPQHVDDFYYLITIITICCKIILCFI